MAAMKRRRSVAALAALGVVLGLAAPVSGHGVPSTRELASGLEGPFGISARRGEVLVAESGTGRILRIDTGTGALSEVATGLPGPAGIAHTWEGLIVAVTAGAEGPEAVPGSASVWAGEPGEPMEVIADLLEHELATNPDGQRQFDDGGEPLDALSNPFSVMNHRGRFMVLVADGGGNTVLGVTRTGEVETFFVPPVINTGACEGAPNNDPEHTGCDPVPTGLAYGPDGHIYVSTLTAEVPGEGRVYELHPDTGEVLDVITGLDGPTGVAVAWDGSVYVSEVLHGAPPMEGPPPPGFDPSTVGRLVRIDTDGTRTHLPVTMPTGLAYHDGQLYSSAWSIAGFLGIEGAGQVLAVRRQSFR